MVFGLLAFFVYKVAMIGGPCGDRVHARYERRGRAARRQPARRRWSQGSSARIALAIVAWRLDLPGLILVILTVFTGASVTTLGTMLALGKVGPTSLGQATITAVFADGWGWYALYVGLVVLGSSPSGATSGCATPSVRSGARKS
jgi:hypothetical protein